MNEVRARVMPEHDDATACSIGLDNFVEAMGEKLRAARDEGRDGWNDPARCLPHYLAELLLEAVRSGDLVSIGNYAMMLHQRDPERAPRLVRIEALRMRGMWLDEIIQRAIAEAEREEAAR